MEQLKTAGMSPEARAVDLVALLRHMVESRAGSRPEPTLTTGEASLQVMAEPDRLTSVLGHIVQNAQDATPPDGRVQIELRRSNDQAIVSIRDNGTGMDEEFVRNRLFRPFDSTKGLTGMGIGAYECREFVRAIGGQVEVESAVGRGTTFVIILPALMR
jgi:signal transduction histidine kinase